MRNISRNVQTPMRTLSTGINASISRGSGRGCKIVHCPSALPLVGSVKHSTPRLFVPPTTIIFPQMKAAACDDLALGNDATYVQVLFTGTTVSKFEQLSISTVAVCSVAVIFPPMAKSWPSGVQTTAKQALGSCILESWRQLKQVKFFVKKQVIVIRA